jgi:hypothetical protein
MIRCVCGILYESKCNRCPICGRYAFKDFTTRSITDDNADMLLINVYCDTIKGGEK